MSDTGDRGDDHDEPHAERSGLAVLWGLLALVAVAAIVGGILAGGALFASRATGLADDGGGGTDAETTGRETLFLPDPTETSTPEQYITLTDIPEPEPESTFTEETTPPEEAILLTSEQSEVGQMQPIDLSGSYPGGDGAVLLVQQFEDGQWTDFPVTVPVNGGEFATFIQASALGENRFRVIDTDTGVASNPIRVTIR